MFRYIIICIYARQELTMFYFPILTILGKIINQIFNWLYLRLPFVKCNTVKTDKYVVETFRNVAVYKLKLPMINAPDTPLYLDFDHIHLPISKQNYAEILEIIQKELIAFAILIDKPYVFVSKFIKNKFHLIYLDETDFRYYHINIYYDLEKKVYVVEFSYVKHTTLFNTFLELFANIKIALFGNKSISNGNMIKKGLPLIVSCVKNVYVKTNEEKEVFLKKVNEYLKMSMNKDQATRWKVVRLLIKIANKTSDLLLLDECVRSISISLQNLIINQNDNNYKIDYVRTCAFLAMCKFSKFPEYRQYLKDLNNLSIIFHSLLSVPDDLEKEFETFQIRIYAGCILLSMKDDCIFELREGAKLYGNINYAFSICIKNAENPLLRNKLCQVACMFS